MDIVWLKSLAKTLLLPPGGLLFLSLVGLLVMLRRPRLGWMMACAGTASLLLLSTPIVAGLLLKTLHPPPPFAVTRATGAEAVVILGGGMRRDAPDYGGDALSVLSLERVRYGARVARLTNLPVLVSGGSPQGGLAEAVLMRRALEDEFHVPVRWIEDRSNNTRENARFTADLLRAAQVRKVVLVTHAFDYWRASAELDAAGITAVPAPVNLPGAGPVEILDWLPSMQGLQGSYYATYELVANAVRAVRPLAP